MRALKDISINAKLTLLALVAGGVAVVLSSAAAVVDNMHLIRSSKVQQLSAMAKVLGSNSTAALTFDDPKVANELLSSLGLHPTVQFARLYDAKGRAFTTYLSDDAHDLVVPLPPFADGYEFSQAGYLDVVQPILQDGEKVGSIYLRASMQDLDEQLMRSMAIMATVMIVSLGAALLLSSRLQRAVSAPVLHLAETAQKISAERDYSIRVAKQANDELGTLYDQFNAMLDEIQRGEKELQQAHALLEVRVEERTRQLSAANRELSREVADRKRTEKELEQVHQQLVAAARRTGMAEVATGVLHNVGNVLNSVNVSATLVADRLRNSKISDLERTLNLMEEHAADLGDFMTQHPQGKRIPGFLHLVAAHLGRERTTMSEELQHLTRNIDHIKTIVAMQQSYAGVAGLLEPVSLAQLLDDALKLNMSSLEKYGIELVRDYADLPEVQVEKQKLLQILVNLITNAKDALVEGRQAERRLTARIALRQREEDDRVVIEIVDNGAGIGQQNLTRVFSHGFTTKRHGHGFGLHSSANAAKELGGALSAQSEGPGRGATFTVEIPFCPIEVPV